jgi:nucleoside-diphosphate-sugar epimerase
VGSNLVEGLLKHGYQVRALVRPGCDRSFLEGLACETVSCDYQDSDDLRRACTGATVVFHLAALTSDWGEYDEFFQANVKLTRAIAEAARSARAPRGYSPRLVYVSSAVVYGCKSRRDLRECDAVEEFQFDYARTKRAAEKYLLGLKDLEVVIVRPGDAFGPKDRVSLPTMVDAMRVGLFTCAGSGRAILCLTYIGNLVKGIILAAEQGRPGEAYNLTDGAEVSIRDYFDALARAFGYRRPLVRPPYLIAYAASSALEWCYRRLRIRKAPPLSRYRILRASHDCHLSIKKAREELGYEPDLDLEAQLKATVDWYRGWKKRRVCHSARASGGAATRSEESHQ